MRVEYERNTTGTYVKVEMLIALVWGTLNFADIEGWHFAEVEGCKVVDTIFSRDGKLPTLFC